MSTEDHLNDIDFRPHEQRRQEALSDFKSWYEQLLDRMLKDGYSDLLQGQLTMLSSVLWYLLDDKDYKRLTHSKKATQAQARLV